jgi:hypothetical protein
MLAREVGASKLTASFPPPYNQISNREQNAIERHPQAQQW